MACVGLVQNSLCPQGHSTSIRSAACNKASPKYNRAGDALEIASTGPNEGGLDSAVGRETNASTDRRPAGMVDDVHVENVTRSRSIAQHCGWAVENAD